MTTKPPPAVAAFAADSLERLAYSVVAEIQTREPNDRNRLGYNVWAWLKEGRGTLAQAIKNSGVRTTLPLEEVVKIVTKRLTEKGISAV